MPEWSDLVGVFGPVGALVVYMIMNRQKPEASKEDPAANLVAELAAMKQTIADLRSEIAGLDGFIRGRMK